MEVEILQSGPVHDETLKTLSNSFTAMFGQMKHRNLEKHEL